MPQHRPPHLPPSRTQRKLQAQRLQHLGERLVALPPDQAGAIPMPEELAAAVAEARGMHKHGARRRQLQYIGALMRDLDPGPIERALADLERGDRKAVRWFKQVEGWRDATARSFIGRAGGKVKRWWQTGRRQATWGVRAIDDGAAVWYDAAAKGGV